jgi:sugar lactone lactonase YvrE
MAATGDPLLQKEEHVSLFVDTHCTLGESPVYDPRNTTLYFVDINENAVHSVEYKGDGTAGAHKVYHLDEPVGCVFLTTDVARVGVATMRRISLISLTDPMSMKEVGVLPDGVGTDPNMRFNDGKVVPDGSHLVVGHMDSKWREGKPGKLYSWSASTRSFEDITPHAGIGLPNGMVWTKDGTVCTIVDSCAESITSYETDTHGVPTSKEGKFIRCSPTGHAHVPDGMTSDSQGNLWVALGESGSVVCYDGTSGEEIRRINLPIRRPTSCNFGGPGLETLFVTSRVETGDDASKYHGGVFAVNIPGISGLMADAMLDVTYL